MEAIEELAQLSKSMHQASALLADEDVDDTSSTRRPSTFLNVVVVGNVGAGKSAVLNSLIGHPVLPTGENGATRAPISIDLDRDSSLSSRSIILQIDTKSQQVSASAIWHSLQDKLSKGSTGRSHDEIYLKLRTSTAPPLKLIDLPGLDQRNMDDSMISQHVEHNDAILLVIIPATQVPEISSSRALRIAKEYDADSTRTVGIISKIDQAATEPKALAAVRALLLNQGPTKTSDIPWVALIGQSVSIASTQSGSGGSENSLETAWRAESESLKSILTGAPQSKLGRVALVEALAGQIRNRMKLRLPNLLSGLQGKSQIVHDELVRLGEQMVHTAEEFLPEPFAEEGIERQITSESQGMVFDIETVEMKSSGEKIGVEFEASGQDKKFGIENIGIEPETSDIDRTTFSIIQGEAHQLCLMWGGLGLTETPKEEDWENVKEIYLMHNELSSLPENPRCPMLLALFLHGNHKLRTIPPSFFDNMPALQILNLSRTGIRSLPESIVRLVNLKRLFLSYCHRFMRLSPKVGELKQLEVLDLEGTDIMDLPKEIKDLPNLTCLKVSLYSCMSDGRRAMQSDVVVACGIISALSHLEELMINVNPDDKLWNAYVEAIVSEVCTLQSLNTLKFYFPRVELVRQFLLNSPMWVHPSLSNFSFTIGHHFKRIMSRLPGDVEFELERWERCLKYINGVAVPREIQKVLQYSTAFFLERHATVKKLSDFGIGNMKQLKCCVVGECNEVEVIIDATDAHEEDSEENAHKEDSEADAHEEDNEANAHEEDDEIEAYREDGSSGIVSQTFGAKTIVLGSLEYLYIYYMKNLKRIWKGPVQPKCLSLLKSLTLRTCPQLTTIFTIGILDNLYNLEELTIDDCPSIKTLVSCKISVEPKTFDFLPNLKRISLHYMPGLVSISSGLHIAPRLEWLSFYNCPNLKSLSIEEVSSKRLKKIEGERSWWEALEWRSGRPSYLDDIFVPINI